MPASEKVIAANRRNAKRSTGPVTAEGKRRSSRNATKHGLYSKDTIINCTAFKENREQYDRLLGGLKKEFSPNDPLEKALVARLANSLWRLRRFTKANRLQDKHSAADLCTLLISGFGFSHTPLPGHTNHTALKKLASRINREMVVIHKLLKHIKQPESGLKPSEAQNEQPAQNGNPNPTAKSYVRSHKHVTGPLPGENSRVETNNQTGFTCASEEKKPTASGWATRRTAFSTSKHT